MLHAGNVELPFGSAIQVLWERHKQDKVGVFVFLVRCAEWKQRSVSDLLSIVIGTLVQSLNFRVVCSHNLIILTDEKKQKPAQAQRNDSKPS